MMDIFASESHRVPQSSLLMSSKSDSDQLHFPLCLFEDAPALTINDVSNRLSGIF